MAINMKFIILLSTIFMMTNGHCGPAKPQEAQISIRTTFNIKNSFCGIYTNEVIGLTTENQLTLAGDSVFQVQTLCFSLKMEKILLLLRLERWDGSLMKT